MSEPWLEEAKDDVTAWAGAMPVDADGAPIDWDWARGLDFAGGLGVGVDAGALDGADWPTAGPVRDAMSLHDALKADYAVRDRLEAIIAQCSTAFMGDFDRLIPSYRLARAMAYANRRLADEIRLLLELGVRRGIWRISRERRGRAFAVVLEPVDNNAGTVPLDDIQDRTAEIVNARAERRKTRRAGRRGGEQLLAAANLGASISSSSATGPAAETGAAASSTQSGARRASSTDWRDVYLPGRDIDQVLGIDIETTGTDPARDYIIDVGFEYMNMASPRPADQAGEYAYEESGYRSGDAYGQARLPFGVTDMAARLGNPFIAQLTGIDVSERCVSQDGFRLFDEWPAAQRGLLVRLTQQPYVAHNATFEHGFFMLNVAGYAEAWRAGDITIIDTLPMSRRWDPGSEPDEAHPYGDNTLDAYAKRQGALPADGAERHLGLEDAHIMLVAMKRHLASLRAEGRGPWGAGGRSGIGGKRCGRR